MTRKLLLLPVANPDGYIWNEVHRRNGGGMKRKNGMSTCFQRDSENDGVDINRNFGFKYAYDSVGSSSNGCSEEFRGAGAFSEPETQAIRDIVQKHRPKAILHWHGWGNDIAFPFSYDWRAKMPAADLGMYQEFASEMAVANRYASGRAWESVGYTTNGEADDWGWGAEGVVSLTIEVGNSRDSFWPPPARILPIASENVWPAHYLAWAIGPMLQLDALSVAAGASKGQLRLVLEMQNNGLSDFGGAHSVCVNAAPTSAAIADSHGWTVQGAGKACTSTQAALKARSKVALPALLLELRTSGTWVELTLDAGMRGDDFVHTSAIRIHNSEDTLLRCGALCACPTADATRFDYSYECLRAVQPGTQCALPKEAHVGSNWASGVLDEYFVFKATQYTKGGRCQVISTHADTLIAVYGQCGRFGALEVLGFANSEGGRQADVTFDCQAGKQYYFFWNAEYMPGRHSFTIKESCSDYSCARAHRSRSMVRRLKRRTT